MTFVYLFPFIVLAAVVLVMAWSPLCPPASFGHAGFLARDSDSQVMSPRTNTNSMNRRNLLMRNGQATPIPQAGNVSSRTMGSSLPALPCVPSDQFSYTMEITNPTTLQVESAGRWQLHAENALSGPRGHEHIVLRMLSQKY